jgi:hypothetical protein
MHSINVSRLKLFIEQVKAAANSNKYQGSPSIVNEYNENGRHAAIEKKRRGKR